MEYGEVGTAEPDVDRVHYIKLPDLDLYRSLRLNVSRRIGLRRTRMMTSYTEQDHPHLVETVEEALRNGVISDEQEDRIAAMGNIYRGIRPDDGSPVWVAVELANYIERGEIELVQQCADALKVVFDEDAEATVQGYRIDPHCLELADALGVHIILVKRKRDYSLETLND